MTRHARRPADNLRLMVMAAAMNPNDGAQDSEDDDRLMIDRWYFFGGFNILFTLSLSFILNLIELSPYHFNAHVWDIGILYIKKGRVGLLS